MLACCSEHIHVRDAEWLKECNLPSITSLCSNVFQNAGSLTIHTFGVGIPDSEIQCCR
jgi:hypothetical protein